MEQPFISFSKSRFDGSLQQMAFPSQAYDAVLVTDGTKVWLPQPISTARESKLKSFVLILLILLANLLVGLPVIAMSRNENPQTIALWALLAATSGTYLVGSLFAIKHTSASYVSPSDLFALAKTRGHGYAVAGACGYLQVLIVVLLAWSRST